MHDKQLGITISAYGKFDLFRWASGFEQEGLLFKLLTDFYSRKTRLLRFKRIDTERIPVEKVHTFLFPRILGELARGWFANCAYHEGVLFDKWASKRIGGSGIVIARSSCARITLQRARDLGIKTILYRGSTHIKYQKEIIQEEYQIWNHSSRGVPNRRVIDRELDEYQLCDYLYVPSSYAAKTYVERGIPAEKILFFPLSIEEPSPDDAVRKDAGISKGPVRVLYVGTLSLGKGIPYLLEAVRKLKRNAEIELLLVGRLSAGIEPFLEKYRDVFKYEGPVAHHLLNDYYRKASLLVLPSIDDGFGLVILEAMSHGLPVIATCHSGAPDVIQDGMDGFIVPIRNSSLLAERILRLCEDRHFAETIGERARKKAKEFSLGHFTSRWLSIFKGLGWLK